MLTLTLNSSNGRALKNSAPEAATFGKSRSVITEVKMKYILMNPKANNGRGESDAREWAKSLKDEHVFVNVLTTEDMAGFVLGLNPDDEIILTGGDGTLNRFANNVSDIDVVNPVYYVKCGSGNDFFRDNAEYVDESGMIRINDFIKNLPVVTINGTRMKFINGIGYGIDGETCRVGEELRLRADNKPINYTNIALKLLMGAYKLKHARITVDGVTEEFDNVWIAATMKGRYYGGGMMVAPAQNRFDENHRVSAVCLFKRNRLLTLLNFPRLYKGTHVKKKGWIYIATGKKIEVSFTEPCALQVDGEVFKDVLSYSVEVAD